MKRTVLSKKIIAINEFLGKNYNYKNIKLLDDNSLVLRSKGNFQKMSAELMDGTCIEVEPIDDTENNYKYDIDKNKISSIISFENSNDLYTINNGIVYRTIVSDEIKNMLKELDK